MDALFKNINILRPLSVEELPETVRIGDHVIKVEMLSNVNKLLGALTKHSLIHNNVKIVTVLASLSTILSSVNKLELGFVNKHMMQMKK